MLYGRMKYCLLVAGMLLIFSAGHAQEYQKQAGIRFGNTTGFTCKFIKDNYFAMEGILGFRNHGAQLYVLLESRRPVFNNKIENMYLYYGGGLHGGYVRWDDYNNDDPYYYPEHGHHYDYNHAGPAFGADAVIGMEYGFESVPITIGVDFKPFFEIYGPMYLRANFWDFGFQVRYNF